MVKLQGIVWTRARFGEKTDALIDICDFYEHLHLLGKELIDHGKPFPNDMGIKVVQHAMILKEDLDTPVFILFKINSYVLGIQIVLPEDFFKQETKLTLTSLTTSLFNTSIVGIIDSSFGRILNFSANIDLSQMHSSSFKATHMECSSFEEVRVLFDNLN